MSRSHWTAAEDAALRECIAQGLGYQVIAERLGRSTRAVRARRARIIAGVRQRDYANEWTPDEDAVLTDAYARRIHPTEIAAMLGRTVAAVKHRRYRLTVGAEAIKLLRATRAPKPVVRPAVKPAKVDSGFYGPDAAYQRMCRDGSAMLGARIDALVARMRG